MANKKLLICAALATGLLLTACVKKEEPKNEEQSEQASEAQTTQAASQPEPTQEFQPLESVDKPATPAPVIEISREQTANTTTEIRRETQPTQIQATEEATAQAEQPKPAKVEQPKAVKPATAQTEDDAVAAAIAAATPALNN
ncbi:MAG: internalin [Acinetobacter sp.]|nr:internalin [Acinetobacter sp.]